MKRFLVIPALILAVAATLACGSARPSGQVTDAKLGQRSLGRFQLAGPTFGSRTLLPGVCVSGQHSYFLGFDLVDEREGVVTRLVVDPASGPVARVYGAEEPFDKTLLFQRTSCRTFHFSIDANGWRINRFDALDVSLDLDCRLPSGDAVVGKASAKGCD